MQAYEISITSCFDYSISVERQIDYVTEVGFSHFLLGMDAEHSGIFVSERLNNLKVALDINRLKMDTIHYSVNLDDDNWYEILECTMKAAVFLCTPIIVAHCTSFMFSDNESDLKLEKLRARLSKLDELCERYHIRVALENLCPGKPTEIVEELLKISNEELIGFCYDSSHDQIGGPKIMHLLNRWKDRLIAVHISDRIREFTDHVTPGEGFIDFDEQTEILKDMNLKNPLLMEMEKTNSKYKNTIEFLNVTFIEAYKLEKK